MTEQCPNCGKNISNIGSNGGGHGCVALTGGSVGAGGGPGSGIPYRTDKIVFVTSTSYYVYGISENGKLYTLENNNWVLVCESPKL